MQATHDDCLTSLIPSRCYVGQNVCRRVSIPEGVDHMDRDALLPMRYMGLWCYIVRFNRFWNEIPHCKRKPSFVFTPFLERPLRRNVNRSSPGPSRNRAIPLLYVLRALIGVVIRWVIEFSGERWGALAAPFLIVTVVFNCNRISINRTGNI